MSFMPQVQELINALGWTLIHFLWQGLGIALAYWLVCRLTQPRHALIRYWTGMAAFLVAAVVPVATFIFYWDAETVSATVQSYSAPIMPVSSDLSFSTVYLLRASMEPVLPLVVALWALGVVLLSIRAFLGWIGAQRLITLDTEAVSDSLQGIFSELMNSLHIQQAVRVLKSARVKVPTVIGWLKPVILLPVAVINRLPEEQLEMIIAHELGHIRRYDYLFNLLQVVLETLFFYHPAIRWMSRQVRQEREHCCDDLVIAQCEKPVLYAKALANLEIMRDAKVPAMVLAASGGDLIERLRRIVRQDLPGNQSGFAQLAVMLGAAAVVSISAQQGLDVSNRFVEKSASAEQTLVLQADQLTYGRNAWVQGVSEFSRQNIEFEATQEVSNVQIPAMPEISERLLIIAEKAVTVDLEIESLMAETPVEFPTSLTNRQVFLPETPVSFGTVTNDAGIEEELASLLAGSTLPSKTRFETERHETSRADEVKVDFSFEAETVVAPVYPFKARRKQIGGYVRLEFSIDEHGHATDIHVVDAQPLEVFEKSAVEALEKWVFKVDASHSGELRIQQIFDFDMENEGPVLSKRERRCEIAGSRICGLKGYN